MDDYLNLSAFFNQRPEMNANPLGGESSLVGSSMGGDPFGSMNWQNPNAASAQIWGMGDGASMLNPFYGSSLQGQQAGGAAGGGIPGQVGSPGVGGGNVSMQGTHGITGPLQGTANAMQGMQSNGFNSLAQFGKAPGQT